MLSSREIGDKPLEVETKTISMVLSRQLPSDISNKPTKIKDSHVTFPPPDELLGAQAMGMAHVDTQVRTDRQTDSITSLRGTCFSKKTLDSFTYCLVSNVFFLPVRYVHFRQNVPL